MPDWMQTGPGPLDLTSPLAAGVSAGQKSKQMEDYRQNEIANRAARMQEMQAALGLQTREQDFRENVFNSMAGQRDAQMTLTQNEAANSTRQLDNVANDQPLVQQWQHDFNEKIANQDFDGALNLPAPDGLKTPQAMQTIEATRNSAATMPAGKAFVENQQAVLQTNAGILKNATDAGIDASTYADPTTGKTNYAALATDANKVMAQRALAMGQAEEATKVAGQEAVVNTKYTAMQPIVDARVKGTQNVALLNNARAQQIAAQKDLDEFQKENPVSGVPDPGVTAAMAQKKAAVDSATQNYNQIQAQVSGQPLPSTAAPTTAPAIQSAPDWLNALKTSGGQ